MKAKYLFLDFDGVLHSKYSSPVNHFSKLKFFEETIRRCPSIKIVISSSWRHHHNMDELLAFFAVDIQRWIIDSTRHVDVSKATNRYTEIVDYLEHTNQTHISWIAIDDAKIEFPENLKNLVLCGPDQGFNDESANTLKAILQQIIPCP